MKKELFEEVCIKAEGEPMYDVQLTYYLLTDSVSEEYCDLKVYGVEIDKVGKKKNGVRDCEKKIISDLFFKRNEAEEFIQRIAANAVTPRGLKYVVNEYIGERIQLCNQEVM